MASTRVTVSATDFPQYRRLVDFLHDVEGYARLTADDDLAARAEAVWADLRAMKSAGNNSTGDGS
jgi:hypothetical protein